MRLGGGEASSRERAAVSLSLGPRESREFAQLGFTFGPLTGPLPPSPTPSSIRRPGSRYFKAMPRPPSKRVLDRGIGPWDQEEGVCVWRGGGFPLCIRFADRSRPEKARPASPPPPILLFQMSSSLGLSFSLSLSRAIPLGCPFVSRLCRPLSHPCFLYLAACLLQVPFGPSWTATSVPKLRGAVRPFGAVVRPKRPRNGTKSNAFGSCQQCPR